VYKREANFQGWAFLLSFSPRPQPFFYAGFGGRNYGLTPAQQLCRGRLEIMLENNVEVFLFLGIIGRATLSDCEGEPSLWLVVGGEGF